MSDLERVMGSFATGDASVDTLRFPAEDTSGHLGDIEVTTPLLILLC